MDEYYLTQQMVAKICGVTAQTLVNWHDTNSGPPRGEDGRYPASQLGAWICREMTLKKGRGGSYPYLPDLSRLHEVLVQPSKSQTLPGMEPVTIVTKEQEETRLKKAQADKAEIELHEKTGQLVRVEDVTTAWLDIVARVKAKLTRIPSALAPLAHGKSSVFEVQEVLENGTREALDELSEDWRDAVEVNED